MSFSIFFECISFHLLDCPPLLVRWQAHLPLWGRGVEVGTELQQQGHEEPVTWDQSWVGASPGLSSCFPQANFPPWSSTDCLGSLPAPALLMGLLGLSLVVLPDLSSSVILSHTSGSCLCTLVRALLSKTVATCGYWTLDIWLVQTEVFCKWFQRLSTKECNLSHEQFCIFYIDYRLKR